MTASDDGASAPNDDAAAQPGRNLAVAVVSGVLLAGIFIGSLFWHAGAFAILVGLLVAVGVVETGRTFTASGQRVAIPVVLVASLVMIAGAYAAGRVGQVIGVAVLFIGAAAWELADDRRQSVVQSIGNSVFLGLWVGFLGSFAVLLATLEQDPAVATLAVAGGAIVTDIGAYFAGTTFGRRLIAPSVSPNKTWEGLIGGLILATVAGVIVLPLVGDRFDDVVSAAVVVFVSGIAGFFGDLFESMFKRDLAVKDMGSIIPGHGGILDRVDGILLALPVGYYVLELAP
ncbi:MAG: phosphatidate cytidylyltransferase [Nitriliruptorales bacterium]|nr:phosphatidate cytidylyltransferase [Nitriliruptorales bacterium]